MADDQHELRHINWHEALSFTHLFKCFRMAMHPSKLALALLAMVLLLTGGWVLDRVWSMGKGQAMEGEIALFASCTPEEFRAARDAWHADPDDPNADPSNNRILEARNLWVHWERQKYTMDAIQVGLSGDLGKHFSIALTEDRKERNQLVTPKIETDNKNWPSLLKDAKGAYRDFEKRARHLLAVAEESARKEIAGRPQPDREEDLKALEAALATAEYQLTALETQFYEGVPGLRGYNAVYGEGIFASFLKYERGCLHAALMAASRGNIMGGLRNASNPQPGFVLNMIQCFKGVGWLVRIHWVFGMVFMIFGLGVWSLLGGAIYRIAALQAARDEKISIARALQFSGGKFLSFFVAPLIPLVVIVILGGLIVLGALLLNIPVLGPLLYSLLLFLPALIVGVIIAFLLFGFVAGGPLMYPTIAVEGSDSFDAISRSISYIFGRPWRAGLYTLVAVVYGSICYLFVNLFVYVSLCATWSAIKIGAWAGGTRMKGAVDRVDAMWAQPTFDTLYGGANQAAMSWSESLAAWIMMVWTYLFIGVVVAFIVTFFCSASTMIYYLLRRQVDATDLDDVYVIDEDQEEMDATVVVADSAEAAQTPAEEADTEE
jgi:hypothetical protein